MKTSAQHTWNIMLPSGCANRCPGHVAYSTDRVLRTEPQVPSLGNTCSCSCCCTELALPPSQELGLAFDEWDLKYYTALFQDDLKRDPTNVELFDMAQSNSEHSRHWFFGANIVIDGQPQPDSLMKIMKSTLSANLGNSVIGFKDNSSAIR